LELRKKYQPEIVFVNTPKDIHQDHQTLTEEATRAFRGTTVLGYDVLRSSYGFFPHFLAEVSEKAVETKIAALAEYTTYAGRLFCPGNHSCNRDSSWRFSQRPYAEGFDIIRIVGQFSKTN
jgi:LmbE family N-acetylglucosaminyl deacetylase